MTSPQFVSLEGVDKTGKTLISEILKTEYPEFEYITDPTELEPWDEIFKNGTRHKIPGIADSFQFFSARLHCYQEKIKPALESGTPVVADRFSDSWLAYQSVFQREYFDSSTDPMEYFERIHEVTENYDLVETPDLTILITIDKELIEDRLQKTEHPTEFEKSPSNQWRVHSRYQELLERNSDRFREVQDTGDGVFTVYSEVTEILEEEGFL